jgi:protein required for attachment to host cells
MSNVPLAHGTWVMVADGQKALFLVNDGTPQQLNLRCVSADEHPDPPTREQGASPPGRGHSSTGPSRSAVEQTDWHQLEKDRFADAIAQRINRGVQSGQIGAIVIVAPPKTLAELRKKFSKETDAKIVSEIHKDLTKHSLPDIEQHLAA